MLRCNFVYDLTTSVKLLNVNATRLYTSFKHFENRFVWKKKKCKLKKIKST